MGADTLLPQPLTHDHGLCAASPSGKCRGLRKVPGTDSVPGTWMGALHRIGETAVLIFAPKMEYSQPSPTGRAGLSHLGASMADAAGRSRPRKGIERTTALTPEPFARCGNLAKHTIGKRSRLLLNGDKVHGCDSKSTGGSARYDVYNG